MATTELRKANNNKSLEQRNFCLENQQLCTSHESILRCCHLARVVSISATFTNITRANAVVTIVFRKMNDREIVVYHYRTCRNVDRRNSPKEVHRKTVTTIEQRQMH